MNHTYTTLFQIIFSLLTLTAYAEGPVIMTPQGPVSVTGAAAAAPNAMPAGQMPGVQAPHTQPMNTASAAYQPPPQQVQPQYQSQDSGSGGMSSMSVDAAIDDALKIRDPFQKPERLRNKITAVEELENIAVEQIRMVGVVTGPKQTSALVIGNGKSFFVTVNTRIGPRKGVVRLITAKGMIVREKIVNVIGREESVDTKIFIEQDPTKKGG